MYSRQTVTLQLHSYIDPPWLGNPETPPILFTNIHLFVPSKYLYYVCSPSLTANEEDSDDPTLILLLIREAAYRGLAIDYLCLLVRDCQGRVG